MHKIGPVPLSRPSYRIWKLNDSALMCRELFRGSYRLSSGRLEPLHIFVFFGTKVGEVLATQCEIQRH